MKFKHLLKRMYFLEVLGEEFYNALSSKSQDLELKSILKQLAQTEKDMSKLIGVELGKMNNKGLGFFRTLGLNLTKGLLLISSQKLLLRIAKSILGKKNYRNWQVTCEGQGEKCFWQALLDHENEQLRLLGPYFK